jgi:hypothetical protein
MYGLSVQSEGKVAHNLGSRQPRDTTELRLAQGGASSRFGGAAQPDQANGPPDFFQASIPPWMWRAIWMPASCDACTAIAERSPNAQ